jgi:hypothetical protein
MLNYYSKPLDNSKYRSITKNAIARRTAEITTLAVIATRITVHRNYKTLGLMEGGALKTTIKI